MGTDFEKLIILNYIIKTNFDRLWRGAEIQWSKNMGEAWASSIEEEILENGHGKKFGTTRFSANKDGIIWYGTYEPGKGKFGFEMSDDEFAFFLGILGGLLLEDLEDKESKIQQEPEYYPGDEL